MARDCIDNLRQRGEGADTGCVTRESCGDADHSRLQRERSSPDEITLSVGGCTVFPAAGTGLRPGNDHDRPVLRVGDGPDDAEGVGAVDG
jgi:hypothetical protein